MTEQSKAIFPYCTGKELIAVWRVCDPAKISDGVRGVCPIPAALADAPYGREFTSGEVAAADPRFFTDTAPKHGIRVLTLAEWNADEAPAGAAGP